MQASLMVNCFCLPQVTFACARVVEVFEQPRELFEQFGEGGVRIDLVVFSQNRLNNILFKMMT